MKYKCKICGKSYTELSTLYNHIESTHSEMIPKDMSVQQYYYYMKTGKMNGNCVMCKQPTGWNKNTCKYNRFCSNPKCKDEYVKIMKSRMVAKYGKTHLLNDPNKQREMLANRSISGTYDWSDGKHETTYTGSYELDFLKTLDGFFDWDPEDISMPSPHTYTYKYEGEDKFYIPDVFIHSLDLEIEIKDGGDNPNNHHKIQDVDKEKERLKDEVMCSQKAFHYIKITNKNYENFFRFLKEIKKEFEKYGDEKKIPRIFKIEDIKGTNVKPVKESIEIEDFNESIGDIIKKFEDANNVRYKDRDKFYSIHFDLVKNNPKELKDYMTRLVKAARFEDDLWYVEKMSKKADDYYKLKIKRQPKRKDEYKEYYDWVNSGGLRKEIKERRKHERGFMENYDIVEENLLLSKDNIEVNLDKFGSSNNILYITGLGGSGKSTIISEYAKKYGAEALEFDAVTSALIKGLENLNRNKIHPIILEYLETQNPNKLNGFTDPNFNTESVKFLNWFENKVSGDGNLYIIEGMQIFICFEPERFINKPMVIMGTSVAKSMYRSTYRVYKRSEGDIIKTFKFFLKTLKRSKIFIKNDKQISELINTVNESFIIEESSISISQMNYYLQNQYEEEMRNYLNTYKKYYNLMLEEQPAAVKHINEDIKKCLIVIDGMAAKGVENNLVQFAKDDLGEIVKAAKHGKPVKVIESSVDDEILKEGYIRNKKDLYVNFELFDSGKSNVCLITGLSGSGKSTLSDTLCKKYNAKCIEMDIFEHPDMNPGPYSHNNIYNDYFNGKSITKNKLINNMLTNNELSMEMSNALLYAINYCNSHPDEKFIIEGLQIFTDVDPEHVKGLPIVFVNTSMINSMVRKYKRDKYNYKIADLFEWYIADEKRFNKFKDNVLESIADDMINIDDSTNDINLISFQNDNVSISNEIIECKLVYNNPDSKQLFSLMDTDSKLIIENLYVIQRDKVGTTCSIRPYYKDMVEENILEFQLFIDKDIDILSLDEKLSESINITNLHKFNDNEFKFIKESCLKLFGVYPTNIKIK